jgi:hypothetical protein
LDGNFKFFELVCTFPFMFHSYIEEYCMLACLLWLLISLILNDEKAHSSEVK